MEGKDYKQECSLQMLYQNEQVKKIPIRLGIELKRAQQKIQKMSKRRVDSLGKTGGRKSFTSSSPGKEELYPIRK